MDFQVQELPPATIDCSTGAGQLVTKPINLKIIEGEPEKLKVKFWMPVSKRINTFLSNVSDKKRS